MGGEWQAMERTYVYIYSHSPSLTGPPELCLLLNELSKCNALESFQNRPPTPSMEKLSTMKLAPGAKTGWGGTALEH